MLVSENYNAIAVASLKGCWQNGEVYHISRCCNANGANALINSKGLWVCEVCSNRTRKSLAISSELYLLNALASGKSEVLNCHLCKELTGGDSLDSNIQLVFNNARLAAKVACEMAK